MSTGGGFDGGQVLGRPVYPTSPWRNPAAVVLMSILFKVMAALLLNNVAIGSSVSPHCWFVAEAR